MTVMEFFGCTFITFGPPFALFLFTIARDPMRVIVLMASGFFWLCALLMSSIVWFAMVPLRDHLAFGVVCSVLLQEIFRFLFYKILRKANDGLLAVSQQTTEQHVTPKDFSNRHIMAYVSGLGFGVIAGTFSIVNVLADMSGPGTIGIEGDSKYFFLTSACLSLCIILLHMCWGVIFFSALDKKQWIRVGMVVTAHMLFACLSLVNQASSSDNSEVYLGSLIPSYLLLFGSGVAAFLTAGGSLVNLKAALICRRGRYEIE
ncbi:gamma-secretase subunit Aph-1b-like protein [Elysia marginata]|uniref:Gamma-secretase subunit Aph-1b-like protein n=1 Tax=Elysia marginata TaxID=1093978 RepID=A0AAV4EVJ1_9GAST|nr:gamma-secretase subunit Aph-1b-like protein [Elysia marginata]